VFLHAPEIHAEVRRLAALGINDCEIARRLSVPRTTVRDIHKPRYIRRTVDVACPRCWLPAAPLRFTASEYAYLLGLYLGDGCIQRLGRTYSFRLSMDAKYPEILAEAREVMGRCSPTGRVSEHLAGPDKTVAVLCVYGNHLPCLFPQHGPGKKHNRTIALETWQESIVEAHPWRLIRGLIQSDGCRFVNRTGKYAYPSYDFAQVSDDIRAIFMDACMRVGLNARQYSLRVRIYRRESVALLDEHVGPKA
jgi:hypothetical protein